MASEMLSSVSPQSRVDAHSISGPSSTAINNNSASAEAKKDIASGKLSRNCSSGEEDGNLVIDTDDDSDKVNKEIKPFFGFQGSNSERKSPVRNNNNNNSVGRGLSGHKSTGNVEKDSNKSLSTNTASKLPSFSTTGGLGQSSKLGKTKSKKSSKSNKSNISMGLGNNTTSVSSQSTSSAAVPFMNALDTDSNHLHNFDSKISLPRASSSSDDSGGKKAKANKSKNHHKKQHNKHLEKSGFSSSGNSGRSDNEKKSKSKHNTSNQSSSSTAAFSLSPEALEQAPRTANNLPARNATDRSASAIHTSNQRFSDMTLSPSTSNSHSRMQSHNNQGRVPARTASITAATGNGAKGAHACSESEAPANQSQSGRKKHKKNQSVASGSSNSRDTAENSQGRDYNYQPSQGKRDRSGGNSTSITSASEGSKSKRMKFEQDAKSHARISSAETNRSAGQVDNREALFGTNRSSGPVGLRTKNGDGGQNSAGNSNSDSSAKTVAPLVFAPSNNFANALPRYNVSNAAETNSNSRSSKEAAGSRQSAGSEHQKGLENLQPTGPSQRTVGTVTSTSDIGVMTEPDSLGPCEPGTSVHLDGIVWHETDTGVLVVNVTWRNRTYMGTLLDATKHDWAPPRFSDSDLDIELRGKNSRPKRTRGGQSESNRKGRSRGAAQPNDDVKNSPSAAAKRRSKNSESEVVSNTDNDGASTPRSSAKRLRVATPRGTKEQSSSPEDVKAESNGGSGSSTCSSPVFMECPHPKCNHRYKQTNALKYHQSHAHGEILDEDSKDASGEEKGADTVNSSPEDVPSDTVASDTDPGIRDEEQSMKHPLADLVLAEEEPLPEEEEEHQPKKKPVRSKEEEIKSVNHVDPKAHSKNQTDSYLLQKNQQPTYTVQSEHLKAPADSSNSIPSSGKPPAPLQRPLPSLSSAPHAPSHPNPASNRKETSHHQQHTVEADIESAEAVATLLQMQPPAEMLPGLSASYSQDSPHPTLSLGSRLAQVQTSEQTAARSEFSNRGFINSPYPISSVVEQKTLVPPAELPPPFPSVVASTDSYSVPPNPTLYRSPMDFVPPPGPQYATGGPQISLESVLRPQTQKDPAFDAARKINYASSVSKENYTVSVSNAVPPGTKVAKGKTVPVPLDPDHSIPSSYAGAASTNKDKKIKRKKKLDGKSSGSPESSPISEVTFPPQENRFQHPPTDVMSSSIPGMIPPVNSLSTVAPPKPPPVVPASENSVPGQPNDPNRRMQPQHHFGAGRKVHGIISPVSSSQSNNITVTGTFHPHPDPHKPQTAVSAQAQDRMRSNRSASPNSSNKNNNNKLGPIPGRSQHSTTSKPAPPIAVISGSPQTDKPSYQEQESFTSSRPNPPEIKTHSQLREASINHMQNQVVNTIESAYSKELSASRAKPSSASPIPAMPRPRESPIAFRGPTADPRPVITHDDSRTPQKSVSRSGGVVRNVPDATLEVRKSSPSPRAKSVADIQHLPHQQHQQPANIMSLYPQIFATQMAFPMEQALQYMNDPALREHCERFFLTHNLQQQQQLLHQQALAQQAQGEKATKRTDEKEAVKLSGSSAEKEQPANWQQLQQIPKRASVASPSPYPQMKEKVPNPPPSSIPPHLPPGGYRPSQAHPHLLNTQDPTRCHSATPSNPPHHQPRPHHARSESLDRGRSSVREERRIVKPTASPTVKVEKSPEKPKESYPSRSPPASTSGPLPYYQYLAAPYAGVPHYAGLQHGYVIPPGASVLHPQSGWIPGSQQHPPQGKQSSPSMKPSKDSSPNRFRSPSKEDIKPAKEFSGHYTAKEMRHREGIPPEQKYAPSIPPEQKYAPSIPPEQKYVPSIPPEQKYAPSIPPEQKYVPSIPPEQKYVPSIPPEQKYAPSPDPKSIAASPAPKKSVSSVASEIPTQMHHHTHHHIHGLIPQYFPGAPPVLSGPDAVPYQVPYQKRERPVE